MDVLDVVGTSERDCADMVFVKPFGSGFDSQLDAAAVIGTKTALCGEECNDLCQCMTTDKFGSTVSIASTPFMNAQKRSVGFSPHFVAFGKGFFVGLAKRTLPLADFIHVRGLIGFDRFKSFLAVPKVISGFLGFDKVGLFGSAAGHAESVALHTLSAFGAADADVPVDARTAVEIVRKAKAGSFVPRHQGIVSRVQDGVSFWMTSINHIRVAVSSGIMRKYSLALTPANT